MADSLSQSNVSAYYRILSYTIIYYHILSYVVIMLSHILLLYRRKLTRKHQKCMHAKSNLKEDKHALTSMNSCLRFPTTAGAEDPPAQRAFSATTLRRMQLQASDMRVGLMNWSGSITNKPLWLSTCITGTTRWAGGYVMLLGQSMRL